MISRSIVVHDFPDFDLLDAIIASALKKLLNTHIHFLERVSVEEERAQKHDRFLRGRQIAFLIFKYFRAAGAFEVVQGLSTMYAISYRKTMFMISTLDGIMPHDLWVKCPQIWSWKDCTRQNSRILFSVRLCWLCTIKKMLETRTAEFFAIEGSCKTSEWSNDENSKLQGSERCCGKRISHQESKRKESLRWEESGSVFSGRHTDNQCSNETHAVSVMTHKPLETVAKVRDKENDRVLLHPTRRQNRLTARGKNRHMDQAVNRKALWTKVKFHADPIFFEKKKKNVMLVLASSHVLESQVRILMQVWWQV